jgi:hypothetical protein
MDSNVSDLVGASQTEVLLSGYSSLWQLLKKEKNDGNFVEVLDLTAKYCGPTMKGDFLYLTKYMAQDLEYFPKGNTNVLPKTYQGNNCCPTDSALN